MPKPFRNTLLWSTAGGGNFNAVAGPLGAVPSANALKVSGVSDLIDMAGYTELFVSIVLASFTGGASPSFQPEWDNLDDDAPANAIPLWKPASVTAATKWATWFGRGQGTAPTIAGWTTLTIPVGFGSFGQLAWTITGGPTAVSWKAFLYAK